MPTTREAVVDDAGTVHIPAAIREATDIESGDVIRWTVSDSGELSVVLLEQDEQAFEDFEPAAMGGDGDTGHDLTGAEYLRRARKQSEATREELQDRIERLREESDIDRETLRRIARGEVPEED